MKHSKKYLVCAFMVGASFVACCIQPMTAKAFELSVGEKAGIQDYFDAYSNGLINLNIDFSSDEDGNRSRKIEIYALQQRGLQDQFKIYDDMNVDFTTTQSMGGSGGSGLYRSSLDNQIHVVTLAEAFTNVLSQNYTARMVYSDEFDISYTFRAVDSSLGSMSLYADYYTFNGPARSVYITHTPHERYQFYKIASDSFHNVTFSNGGQVTCTLQSSNGYSHSTGFAISNSSTIPTFNFSVTLSSNSTAFNIGSCGTFYTLPDADVYTVSPWDYYNDYLLPYIRQNYNIENIDQYLVFPNGYSPDPSHTTAPVSTTIPIIYPTAPVFDQGLDESGTQPTGIESINYELPQLETKTVGIPAFDLTSLNPNQVMQPLSNGLAGLWALVTDLLNTFELFPLVSLALLVGVIGGLLLLGR